MLLSELLRSCPKFVSGVQGDADLTRLVFDSRKAANGALFVCVPGHTQDSHDFIPAAVENGASAVLAHSLEGFEKAVSLGVTAAWIPKQQFEDAAWRLSKKFYRNPTGSMKLIGVTGTNGKTTTAWLIRDMLAAQGCAAGYIGTLGLQYPGVARELNNTTPMAFELYELLAEARDAGVQAMSMEVSSHALHQQRVGGLEFDAAVFTNLTQDHLDYHGTMAEYENAKRKLFEELPLQSDKKFVGAIHVGDPTGARWASEMHCEKITYGLHTGDLKGDILQVGLENLTLKLSYGGKSIEVEVPLGGNFNVENSLSAATGFLALGNSLSDVAKCLPKVHRVPGRFEAVPNESGFSVLVDYAHTPDALEKLLDSVRELNPRRVITVFGCGGDRDRTKRPLMARAASLRSDLTIVTSDNPRTEDPASILAEVASGIEAGHETISIIDRREAIAYAVQKAEPGDVVVIAGKGHENYQIIGHTKYPMDDRHIAREALNSSLVEGAK